MVKGLYRRVLALAESPRAPYALGAIAFAESSFFPIPPDLILIPMSLSQPRRAWFYASVATVMSVIGGLFGYAIGALLYNTVGQWLIAAYGYGNKLEALRESYQHWGWLLILIKGLTPIPYKLVTIVSGLLGYNLLLFVLLSLLTRGARFFIVAGLLNRFGDPLRGVIERHFAMIAVGLLVIVVFGFWLAAHMAM